MTAVPKCNGRKSIACSSSSFRCRRRRFPCPPLFVTSLCCCFDVLLAFDLNINRPMPMASDNGISSAYTNHPVALKAMPHNPTPAEESPYAFWHENKPFVHVHGDEPGRHTMRHQHFARLYYDDTSNNFITDPPGMGLNTVGREAKREGEGVGIALLFERKNAEGRAKSVPTTFVGDEEPPIHKGGHDLWWKSGERTSRLEEFTALNKNGNQVVDQISAGLAEASQRTQNGAGHGFSSSSAQNDGAGPGFSSNSAPMFYQQTPEPILRFYHRPKASKSNLPPPTIVVPASSSTLEASADDGGVSVEQQHQKTTLQHSVVDADIPFAAPTDLRDTEPFELVASPQLGSRTSFEHVTEPFRKNSAGFGSDHRRPTETIVPSGFKVYKPNSAGGSSTISVASNYDAMSPPPAGDRGGTASAVGGGGCCCSNTVGNKCSGRFCCCSSCCCCCGGTDCLDGSKCKSSTNFDGRCCCTCAGDANSRCCSSTGCCRRCPASSRGCGDCCEGYDRHSPTICLTIRATCCCRRSDRKINQSAATRRRRRLSFSDRSNT
uniref:Uncharacterized protein n=1 Tax=Globodera rostochiensis TaxID=31243 RepID=A0A914HD65_GLORO